ncbi:MAG: alanyl-tRNA editing protein AlaXM [Candidatus Micrarchaeota archaeon]
MVSLGGDIYLTDSYMKECESTVVSVTDDKYVVLDKMIFYPKSGGQPWDTGKLFRNDDQFNVVYVGKFGGKISHEVDMPGLKEGDTVRCLLDWDRRYALMRYHTAAHVLASVVHKGTGALITGNQLGLEKTRFDFSLEDFDREKINEYVAEANEILKRDIELKIYSLSRDDAMKIPGIVKLAGALPPDVGELRIVEIPGVDLQADGGTHVKNVNEVGQIELLECVNKGKNNRRVYFRLR